MRQLSIHRKEKSGKNDRRKYNFLILFTVPILLGLVFDHFHRQRLISNGIRTTAIVTEIEIRDIFSQDLDAEVRHYITYEYEVEGQTIVSVRSSTHNRGVAPRARVGDQVEIYYDERNPRNFVFARETNRSGIFDVILFLGLTGIIVFSIHKIRMANRQKC